MRLRTVTSKRRDLLWVAPLFYRLPLPVRAVLRLSGGDCYPICPRCGETFEREYMRFCDRCGQRLGWEFFALAEVVQAEEQGEGSAIPRI